MPEIQTLDYRNLPIFKPLFLDYLSDYTKVERFFAGNPAEADTWSKVAQELQSRKHPRTKVAGALRELNMSLGADEQALATIDGLEKDALVVITGQQVGLFGGPLYTLYKALSAVRVAAEAQQRLGVPVIPLFWMDSDDHDFAEVQSAAVVDASHDVAHFRYEDASESNRPVGRRKLTSDITGVVDALAASLRPSEFKDAIVAALSECYAPGRTMAEAFGSWLLRLTRGTGLAVVDPSLPALKAQGAELFAQEIAHGSKSTACVEKASEDLAASGYHAQASPAESGINLFQIDPERTAISVSGDKEATALAAEARQDPSRFSPNVLLRPIYQDTLFPTLAYVAGPSELAYFAQLGGVYEHFGVTMPLIVPRASATIVESPQAKFLDRYEIDVPKLMANDESVLNEILRRQTPPALEEDLSRARRCIEDITSALERDLRAVDASLVPTVQSTKGKLLHHLKDLEAKSLKAIKRKNDTVKQQFLATRSSLFPDFVMQERKVSALGYLAKYGWHFVKIAEAPTDPELKAHVLLRP